MLSLNGKWKIKDETGEYDIVGMVPGVVQSDLIRMGKLPHPYVGRNAEMLRKLEEKRWEYKKEFEFSPSVGTKHFLIFKGVDTIADIYLNDEYLGSTEDMFIEYRFDVSEILKKSNVLVVRFKSPVSRIRNLERAYGKLMAGPEEPSRSYVRKAQYSFGWDWGVRMVTIGIWKDVYIESYEDGRLCGCTAYLENLQGNTKITGYVREISGKSEEYSVMVSVNGEKIGEIPVFADVSGIKFDAEFHLPKLELWYPIGVGKSTLHDFEFVLTKNGKELYRQKKRIGLRTIELVRESDAEGESFIFQVNGRKVFAKGANWIPTDNILTWTSSQDYRTLLEMAKKSNMNMLRVWGGGVYEREIFYELCDELGIMVWQDFMFACAEYPDHLEWFRDLANKEVRENVVKLRHHPSIVLWCGNNENNWGFDEWKNFARKVDGEFLGNRLYLHDFPKICAEEDPSRPYWPSSPYGGSKPNSQDGGDSHNWEVWSTWKDYSAYDEDSSRFVSEFGFQSAPDRKTVEFFSEKNERTIFSDTMLYHNKQVEGAERIMKFVHNHFGLVTDFESILYLSQINQAEAIKKGVEHWRGRKFKTAGTLYWQFNDSWPVFSWSAVDYFKRPKALYHYTKRFFSPLLPILEVHDNSVTIKTVNDEEEKDVSLNVEFWNVFDERPFLTKVYRAHLAPNSVTVLDEFALDEKEISKSMAYLSLEESGRIFDNSYIFLDLRQEKLPDPEIDFVKKGKSLKLSCKRPAYAVNILCEEKSENFFSLFPSHVKWVENVEGEIQILSMYDYQQLLKR